MHIKLLALDIDGTLVTTEKNIPAGNKTAIRRFMKNGGIVTIASGRPISGVTRYAEELGLNVGGGYVITYNGSRIFDARTGELLYEKNLSAEQSARIIDVAEKYNVPITTYKGDTAVTDNADDKYFYLEVNLNNLGLQRVPSLRKEVTYPVPKYLITGEPDYITETEKLFKNELSGVSVFRSEPFFLEITPLMVDKGTALMWLADSLGIRREQVMACGDGYNDITMISEAGIGVAMENAQEPAKNAADFVTLSNDDNGVAAAIKKFAFNYSSVDNGFKGIHNWKTHLKKHRIQLKTATRKRKRKDLKL